MCVCVCVCVCVCSLCMTHQQLGFVCLLAGLCPLPLHGSAQVLLAGLPLSAGDAGQLLLNDALLTLIPVQHGYMIRGSSDDEHLL